MDPRNQPSLLERIYSWENLLDAYHEAASEKWYRNDVTAFAANLEENLISIQNDLIWHTYKVGRYRQFYVHEPKKRLVMALGFRDRVVQWAIYLQTNQYLDNGMIYHSYGCRVGKGTTRAADRLQYWCTLVDRKAGQMVLPEIGRIKVFLPGGSHGYCSTYSAGSSERGRLPLAYGNDYKLRPYALRTASGKVRPTRSHRLKDCSR
jgi:hypothetical protein